MYREYETYIKDFHDNLTGRESIEWSTSWIDKANVSDSGKNGRVLFIGDSTLRAVRGTFANITDLPVDCIGSSSGLHDLLFAKQMDAFLCSEKYRYSAIFIQTGYHSLINDNGNSYEETDYVRFRTDFEAYLDYLSQFCTNIILLSAFYAVKPPAAYEAAKSEKLKTIMRFFIRFRGETWDAASNLVIGRKNDIISKIADKRGLRYFDINKYMIGRTKKFSTRIVHTDVIHYETRSIAVIAEEYRKLLLSQNVRTV